MNYNNFVTLRDLTSMTYAKREVYDDLIDNVVVICGLE